MQKLFALLSRLDRRKQVILAAATIAIVLSLSILGNMAARPSMQLLYAGLEGGSAGDIVSSLDQRGVVYQVRGGSIYVPANRRDELRMTLASEGLPSNGAKGYELLDGLSGFGTTSQMFDAAYWRAKEGELARTIVTSPNIGQARVHLANTGSNPFRRDHQPSASVSVVSTGQPIGSEQANAIRHLVAAAVSGLTAQNVAVIDAQGALIEIEDSAASPHASGESRAQILRERALRLVEARVGAGNAVVEVSIDTVTDSETVREKRIDPDSRIAISTDLEERSNSSTNQSGQVTVASNLPDGDASKTNDSNAETTSTRERINYEISETELEILRAPGDIKRLTVAVLVNGVMSTAEDGSATFAPRSEEEMAALRELVSAAVGFNADRGDVITLKSMELPAIPSQGTQATSSLFDILLLDTMGLIQFSILAVVSLILGLFVVRPIFTNPPLNELPPLEALPASPKSSNDNPHTPALTGEIDDQNNGQFAQTTQIGLPADGGQEGTAPALSEVPESPVERLRSMIGERQEETVEVLRSWLEESEETA